MKLYGYFRSSAAYRVRIALNLKKLPYEQSAVHLLVQRPRTPRLRPRGAAGKRIFDEEPIQG